MRIILIDYNELKNETINGLLSKIMKLNELYPNLAFSFDGDTNSLIAEGDREDFTQLKADLTTSSALKEILRTPDTVNSEIAENNAESGKRFKCVICNEMFSGFGNNAEPIATGQCCNFCNINVVLTRLKRS